MTVKRRSRPKRGRKPIPRRGKRRFPNREDREFLTWIRLQPCIVCKQSGQKQTSRTEVEHWVTKARGGYDCGDTFPTCARHREERHTWGDQTFQEVYSQRNWAIEGAAWVHLGTRGVYP